MGQVLDVAQNEKKKPTNFTHTQKVWHGKEIVGNDVNLCLFIQLFI